MAVQEIGYAELADRRPGSPMVWVRSQSGERVFALLGRTPDLYAAVLGSLKARCVVSPLFATFGPEQVAQTRTSRHQSCR